MAYIKEHVQIDNMPLNAIKRGYRHGLTHELSARHNKLLVYTLSSVKINILKGATICY